MAVLLVALLGTAGSGAQPAAAHEEDVHTFTGSGWGHSIGMSQYGAYGQALDDATHPDIINYYYDGVTIEYLDDVAEAGHVAADHPLFVDDAPVWVGLRQSASSLDITPVGGVFELCQRVDGSLVCVDLGWTDEVAETWSIVDAVEGEVTGCLVTRVDPEPVEGDIPPLGFGTCEITISWGDEAQADRIALDGDACGDEGVVGRDCLGRGTLQVRSDQVAAGFHVSLEIGVEEYLYGLGEMPSSWPTEALKAQVLAARSFVVRRFLTWENPEFATSAVPGLPDSRKATCWCHVYSTSVDQNYVGHAKEADSTYSPRWVDAVDATAGQVITHPDSIVGTVILALYHSSSGGYTESNEAVWGTTAMAYLQAVPDPWSNDESVSNPYAEWSIAASGSELAVALGWDDLTHVTQTAESPNGQFEFRGILDGEAVTEFRSSGWLYGAIGARSPHFESVSVERFRPFLDMDGTGHGDAIYAVWETGISLGCGDDYYCPDDLVTRAQMATFLARALELDPILNGPFTDVAHTGIHLASINAIAEARISLGCAEGQFCPDDLVSRAQMASFMARALGLDPDTEDVFTDLDGVGVHRYSINAIAAEGISLGCGEGLFCPDDLVSRAQMASFLARAFVWVDTSEPSPSE